MTEREGEVYNPNFRLTSVVDDAKLLDLFEPFKSSNENKNRDRKKTKHSEKLFI